MSTINPYFTFQYSQPEEYRFSHDSVFLAQHVFKQIKNDSLSSSKLMDLCAGCGVVGLDLLWHLKQIHNTPAVFDFVEIQKIYESHFQQNTKILKSQNLVPTQLHFLNLNYTSLITREFAEEYDCIVSNPPYFLPHQGKLSPSDFKNRCRFFLDASFDDLMAAVAHCLKSQGRAYILVRSLHDHGLDLTLQIPSSLTLVDRQDIRGTDVLHLTKI